MITFTQKIQATTKLFVLVTLAFVLQIQFTYSQQKSYGRFLVDTLCSETFNGRGYYKNGTNKAATFIFNEMKKNGLSPTLQPYSFPVNTFQGNIALTINDNLLIAGHDYLVDASCPSSSGKATIFKQVVSSPFHFNDIKKKKLKNKILVIDVSSGNRENQLLLHQLFQNLTSSKKLKLAGVVLLVDKLTHRVSNKQSLLPSFILLKDRWLDNANTLSWTVESKFIPSYEANNVIGTIQGEQPDSFLVISAHLDHLGQMGNDVIFPGANDNASGVAMLMSIAKHFAEQQSKPKYSLKFIAFSGEEAGLQGSRYFVDHPTFNLSNIKFLLNLDIMGTGDDGIQVVNGKIYQDEFDELVRINEAQDLLAEVKIRGEACNSDHCPFYEKGVPSFFIYTLGGVSHYHDVYDKAETLPLTEFEDLQKLLLEFIERQ